VSQANPAFPNERFYNRHYPPASAGPPRHTRGMDPECDDIGECDPSLLDRLPPAVLPTLAGLVTLAALVMSLCLVVRLID
jgi:hypothetical protein